MKERPILFSAPMVRAILEGRKMQTRRIADISDPFDYPQFTAKAVNFRKKTYWWDCQKSHPQHIVNACPYGIFGDRLWVRETHLNWWKPNPDDLAGKPIFSHVAAYAADGYELEAGEKWIPSIHMLRAASRINLEITGIRVERLQDISEADAIAEGVSSDIGITFQTGDDTPIGMYGELWESINGQGSWDLNPWVWVIEFKQLTGNENGKC